MLVRPLPRGYTSLASDFLLQWRVDYQPFLKSGPEIASEIEPDCGVVKVCFFVDLTTASQRTILGETSVLNYHVNFKLVRKKLAKKHYFSPCIEKINCFGANPRRSTAIVSFFFPSHLFWKFRVQDLVLTSKPLSIHSRTKL